METSDKYFVEIQLECVLETNEEDKIELIKKINNAISRMLKGQKVIHYSSNIDSMSEDAIVSAYVTSGQVEN